MSRSKIGEQKRKINDVKFGEYDNYVAVDWSKVNMAIARLTRHGAEPKVFERPTDIEELKLYLKGLPGKTILTIEETTTAHWLYLELHDVAGRILICDPYRNRLLSDGPKTDKIDAGKLCELLRAGLLKGVFHTDDELYELRRLVSAYDDVVRSGVGCLNQRYSLVSAMGPGDQSTDSSGSFILDSLGQSIELYEKTKGEYEKKFEWWCRRNKLLKSLLDVNGILFPLDILFHRRRGFATFPRRQFSMDADATLHFCRRPSSPRDTAILPQPGSPRSTFHRRCMFANFIKAVCGSSNYFALDSRNCSEKSII